MSFKKSPRLWELSELMWDIEIGITEVMHGLDDFLNGNFAEITNPTPID